MNSFAHSHFRGAREAQGSNQTWFETSCFRAFYGTVSCVDSLFTAGAVFVVRAFDFIVSAAETCKPLDRLTHECEVVHTQRWHWHLRLYLAGLLLVAQE